MSSSEDKDFVRRVSVDFTTVASVGLVVLFLELFGQPTKRGFFCDDESIKYPFTNNTISEGTIALCAVFIPLLVFICTELWHYGARSRNRLNIFRWSLPIWMKTIPQFYGVYLIGLGFAMIICELGKFTTGRLRPHFISVCNPNVNCSLEANKLRYIEDYTCTGTDADDIFEARLSFPSGHSCSAFYAAVYLVAYLQTSRKWAQLSLLRNLIQFLFILAAWYVSLSRVMDHWHHWSDVLVGILVGTIGATAMIIFVSDMKLLGTRGSEELLPLRKTNSTSYVASNQS